ncbi:CDP-alcohol phosphatidyltransferase family protein [Budviciaceae bacterium CWB-B4]|uniref:CDP-alcohol phosphatidyltransferase family protein n=1 Tax=Limnobaculum xujianqingii TaxID=2738837 RepID=A0A9D7AGR0_9GAMM|nr:CDP-alcohol phosphatidyltransferase family protein [Limnobaculum xujianqingii]MBK5072386.1 CDP-alcohol phosphatidyltransferase family protein [Limnobaculum xujianqingii]MBK5175695.1 CDP-alcohol phosphatidyltransferase family protein [Limnobaculum xujianqingii]
MTLYDLKPRFQALLRPLLKRLFRAGVTANQVTLAALIASVAIGVLLFFFPRPVLFLILPIFLFIRMALNAIDGLLAREYNQKSKLGALLNETGDVISDAALYLPFALLPGATPWLVLLAVLLSILTEFCGVLAQTIGASRRYDGPMGKSDRALIFGAYALAIFIWPVCMEWSWILFSVVSVLLVWTCLNRCRRALAELNS